MQPLISSAPVSIGPYALPVAISRMPRRTLVFVLMAGYIALLPIQLEGVSIRFAPSDVFLGLAALLGISSIHVVRRAWTAGHLGLMTVFLTATFIAAREQGAISSYELINKDAGLLLLLLTYAILTTLARDWNTIRGFLRIFLWAVFIQNIVAIAALAATTLYGIDIPMWNYQNARLSGLLVDPNAYGSLLLVAAAIHLPTYFSARPIVPGIPGAIGLITVIAGIGLTFSRSCWIGFAAFIIFCVPWQPKLVLRLVAGMIVAVTVLVALQGRINLQAMADLAKRPDQVQARLDQFTRAVPLIEESPILGIGIGGFVRRNGVIIHNTSLWLTTEFGLVGLLALLTLILGVLGKGVQAYRASPLSERPLIVGLMGAHVSMVGVSLGIEALYQRHWWMVMAFLGSAYAITRKPSVHCPEMALSDA